MSPLFWHRLAAQPHPYQCPPLEDQENHPPHHPRDPHQCTWFALRTLLEQMRREYSWEVMNYSLEWARSEFYIDLVHDVLSCRECWFDGPFVVFCPQSIY